MCRVSRSMVAIRWVIVVVVVCTHGVSGESSRPGFLASRTTVWIGSTQLIPIRGPAPSATGVRVDRPEVLEIAKDTPILTGEKMSFIRVRGMKEGTARLSIADATMEVRVASAPGRDDASSSTRIVGPAPGAVVWGIFTLSVELNEGAGGLQSTSPIRLRFPSGQLLEPEVEEKIQPGPTRRLLFAVDAQKLPPGPALLTVVEDGKDAASVLIQVQHTDAAGIISDECENHLSGPRPKRNQKVPPRVGDDPTASGGKCVINPGAEPAWCLPFTAKQAGQYQVMIAARGDFGGGAFPTVGLYLDEADRALTAARVPDQKWRRFALGRPIRMEAGEHILTVYFMNDFYAPDVSDRNLYLDRYEIARVDSPASGSAPMSGDSMMAPMMQDGNDEMMQAPDGAVAGEGNAAPAALRIAWVRQFHGSPIRGTLNIQGLCAWTNSRKSIPPRVDLLVNGKPVMSQRAPDPTFLLDPGFFHPGANQIQLRATLDSGTTAIAPAQTIIAPDGAVKSSRARAFHRFSVLDEAWGETCKPVLTDTQRPEGHRIALFASNGQATLKLPDELSGNFEISLDARGEEYQGPPIASVSLKTGETVKPLSEVPVPGWWNIRKAGVVDLPKGPKQLVIAFNNDLYEKDKGDRNLWLGAVTLREAAPAVDRSPPHVAVLYPGMHHDAFMADVVVAEAWDEDALADAEIWLDGKKTSLESDHLGFGTGRLVFPLALRSVSPGKHVVKVRVTDAAGNIGESEEIALNVLDKQPAVPSRYDRAIRLLDRFAYGAETDELAAVLTMGERPWLEDRLGRSFDDPGEQVALGKAVARTPNLGWQGDISQRVLQQILMTNNPARERFVQWTQNHFSTWVQKTEAPRKWEEHMRFSRLGAAPFPQLLMASATSPAMLSYLDQQHSVVNRLNENYAREIMELHTLGVNGGYTQEDVTTLARLLTGWTFSEEADPQGRGYPLASVFRYDPALNDGKPKHFLGVDLPEADSVHRYDRTGTAFEILAAHPSTAHFVCRKLVEHYVAMPAPEPLVNDLAQVFMQNGGDMKPVLLAMAEHPAFWKSDLAPKVSRPMDFAVHLGRCCHHDDPWVFHDFLLKSGMGIYDRTFPDGYPETDAAYADSNAMLQRWKLAKNIEWDLTSLIPNAMRNPSKADPEKWRQEVVDVIAIRLTGHVLTNASNESALKIMASSSNDQSVWTRQITGFVSNLSEASLR